MPYDPQKHYRRSIRLKGYDYTQPGAYFVTLCTKARQCLFGDVVNREMRLNSLGHIAFTCWQAIPDHFPHVELDAFVVMPNHLHGILVINETLVGAIHESPLRYPCGSAPKSLGAIVGLYKAAVSKRINAICNTQGNSIWQRNYYEIINRNNKSLDNMRQYVVENPRCWTNDPENPQHHRENQELLLDLPF
jgi:REP element-mobilizing transposase RayT